MSITFPRLLRKRNGGEKAFTHVKLSIQWRDIFFFSFVRWKFQSPRWRWQCIAGPSGFHTACGLRECGLARFPFWVARRWGRTAVDVLLSDCQYRTGTALYGQCGVWNTGDSWGGCGLSSAWILQLVPVWLTGSSLVVPWVLVPPLAVLLGLEDGLHVKRHKVMNPTQSVCRCHAVDVGGQPL